MTIAVPEKVHLIPDDHHLDHVGRLSDGKLYWIDVQLSYNMRSKGTRDFVCLYLFKKDGTLTSYNITDLGFRSAPIANASNVIRQYLENLPEPISQDIWVRPFSVDSLGLTFGLVIREEADEAVVDALPGWTIMFYPPWPEGGYDT